MTDRDGQDRTESRRILDRVARESDPSGSSYLRGRADRLKNHLSAGDIDPADRVEVVATRVGRTVGFIITVLIIGWLLLYIGGG